MQRCEHLADGVAGTPYPLPGGILAELCGECLSELQQRLEEQIRAATPIEVYARERESEMERCAYTVRKLVPVKGKKGKKEYQDLPGCSVMAQEGSAYCPRHTFFHNLAEHERNHKALMAHEAKQAGVAGQLPPTRAQLIAQGYTFTGTGECRSCGQVVEWWSTPKGKRAPFEMMAHENSFSRSHFAGCKGAAVFRRAS